MILIRRPNGKFPPNKSLSSIIDTLDKGSNMKKKELLDLIIRLQERVVRLEQRLANYPSISIPYIQDMDKCVDGDEHTYPNPWFGTVPPSCTRCGKQGTTYTVTCSDSSSTCACEGVYPCRCSRLK